VGIGTSSPQGQLDVTASGATVNQFLTGGVGNNLVTGIFKIGSGLGRGASIQGFRGASSNIHSLDFYTYNSADVFAMRIDSSGKVLIGASSSDLSGSSQAMVIGSGGLAVQFGGTTGTFLKVNPGDANGVVNLAADARSGNYPAMTFTTSATERMRIDSSGNLLVGCNAAPSASVKGMGYGDFSVMGSDTSLVLSGGNYTGSDYQIGFVNGNGRVGVITTSGSATSYATSSDYRLKENVQTMTGALEKVSALNPVTYKWKSDGSNGEGFIAHELAEVCPDAVTGEKDAVNDDGSIKPQSIDTSFLVATLTAAIQELKALADTQASTITTLTDRITALESI
jgi:hypothetical protein